MDSFGDFLRTATRPFLVVLFGITLVAAEFEGVELSLPFQALAYGVIGEWPIERLVLRAKESKD